MNHRLQHTVLIVAQLAIVACSTAPQKASNTTNPIPTETTTTQPETSPAILVPTPYVPTPYVPESIKPTTKKNMPATTSKATTTKTTISKAATKSNATTKSASAHTPLDTTAKSVTKSSTPPSKTKQLKKKVSSSQDLSLPTPKHKQDTIQQKPQVATLSTTLEAMPEIMPPAPSVIEVSIEALPLKIAYWTLDQSQSIENQCSLVSATSSMEDGQGRTPIYLEVTEQDATFYTKSNIDISYSGTGVFIKQQEIAPIEALYTPTSVRLNTYYKDLIRAMKRHQTIEIKLGFWPSWPVTQAYEASLAINNFESAYNALQQCNDVL